jgi:DNA-binding transcriptional LysR family regulator
MKLHRLKIFGTIAKHLNVTAAADELYLSQPAASLHLKLLEEEYGLILFKRKNSGMELTDDGREFLEAVKPILAGIESVDARFKDRHRSKTRPKEVRSLAPRSDVVLVGSNHSLVESLFSNVLVRFRERWRPEAQLVLEVGGSNSIETLVDDCRLDVALISNPRQLPNCEYEAFQETKYEVAVVAGSHTPLSKYTQMNLEELLQQPLVVRAGSTCMAELRRRGHEFGSVLQCRTPEAAKLAIAQGMGIGLVLRSWVQPEIDRGEMVAITVPEIRAMTYQCYITWNKRRALSGHAQHLIQTMREMKSQRLCA